MSSDYVVCTVQYPRKKNQTQTHPTATHKDRSVLKCQYASILDPGKGVCAEPVKRGAILEGEGPGTPSGDNERQLSPDRGGGKTSSMNQGALDPLTHIIQGGGVSI